MKDQMCTNKYGLSAHLHLDYEDNTKTIRVGTCTDASLTLHIHTRRVHNKR
jgi:hypothetical protein